MLVTTGKAPHWGRVAVPDGFFIQAFGPGGDDIVVF
jgi:hypothetical protein